jgi:DNA-binding NtrC family response regulator
MESLKMMLVDDEERFLATTQKLLQKKGYDVLIASSGAEALEKLRTHPVQVVILDVKMPGMDGNATLKEIKRQFPLIEVIMLTGHATVESAIDGLKSGASDYLMKPADIGEVIQKAEDAYARRQTLESKIRVAQMRKLMGSPREIIQDLEE